MGSAGVEILKVLMLENPLTDYSVTFFIWGFVFRWFPTYSLVRGIAKVKLLFKYNAICRTGGELLAEACRDPNFANDDRVSHCCQARQENVTARLLLPLEPFYETGFYEAVSMVVEGLLYVAVLSFVDSPLAYTVRAYIARCLHGTADEDEAAVEKGPRLVATSLDPEVEREVKLVNQVCRTRAFKDVAMAIRNLQKTVGLLTKVKIVDGASILLNQGECLGLVGVNGSGKTTLLEILVGLVVPTGGGAYTSALSLGGNLRSWQQGIGYAPDGISEQGLPPLTVGEYLDMVASLRGVTSRRLAIASALTLIHGELKMLLISSAAIGVPPILLVDEPYSDVEPLYRNDIIRMLQVLKGSQAMSMIMTSHR
ncbi:hypothetical protein HPB48_009318 [Haemaphysalis longicornis]|uniref:ABC transporter domain-containing protein n=1 Tax=Haemaphysalis longicornis TaxID=44386 RepID=A0A9J6G8S1_HAELO|nr:hypothetical protein HPB48_009318 [Haemaphysalis longicornis]